MDDVDRAQVYEERMRADAIERAAAMARQALGHHATSTACVDCGGEIEAARVAHGFETCFPCAQWRERWSARWGTR